MEEAISLLEEKNATYALEKTSTNGILNLSYIYTKASGKAVEGSKTVYSPAIHADGKIFEYSLEAGKIGWQKYRNTAIAPPFDVNHGGINFRVYINSDKYGNQFIGNVHPTR
ncbi:CdiA family toxin C-terminal domain-containing protein [Pseudomonas sp. RIT-PI-S]|uniref:CdiA family toxin C-terminal domain-containing protein n=1 Tax=Pseudomonas sp. RIT-PI-S TaxID=3035295 RepID=UPI0021D8CD2A|nr:CdiA family toxin C-terminal domain-containing protein [Pseudomonas sp. RIT-PI-S]